MALGRATKDPEILESKKKTKFAKFSLAVNDYKHEDKVESTNFYEVVIFGKSIPTLTEKLKKGDLIFVKGKLESEAYLSNEKEPKVKNTILVDEWHLIK